MYKTSTKKIKISLLNSTDVTSIFLILWSDAPEFKNSTRTHPTFRQKSTEIHMSQTPQMRSDQ